MAIFALVLLLNVVGDGLNIALNPQMRLGGVVAWPHLMPERSGPIVELRGVTKRFGTHEVLRDVDLVGQSGEKVVIIGASGSGKSTLLRCINGLEAIQSGVIVMDGIRLGERDLTLLVHAQHQRAIRRPEVQAHDIAHRRSITNSV
jgi:ABC-type multidrug transport system fused ATPase/permease subunit